MIAGIEKTLLVINFNRSSYELGLLWQQDNNTGRECSRQEIAYVMGSKNLAVGKSHALQWIQFPMTQ